MKNTDYLVISTSLNPESKSRVLARQAHSLLNAREGAEWMDLQDFELPLCDGNVAYSHANVAMVTRKIQSAQCIIVATPIYNFDVNAALKNLIELTGQSWNDKIVGFLCAAGGKSSYMSVMSVANSLMLDFRSIIIPRFVYVDQALGDQGEIDEPIRTRIEELTNAARRLMGKVKTTV